MSKKSGNGLTLEQQRELCTALAGAAPTDMSVDIYSGWTNNRRALNRVIRKALLPPEQEMASVINADPIIGKFAEGWEKHYKDEYGLNADFSGVYVPIRRAGLDRLIFVIQGITCNQVFAKCDSKFPSWRWTTDLDAAVKSRNDRESTRPYAIWTRGGQEPDDIKMTANQTAAIGFSGTTLLEELLEEPKWFQETGQHRNVKDITRCDGSRVSDGGVPDVSWGGSKFRVGCCLPDIPHGSLRPRSAVS